MNRSCENCTHSGPHVTIAADHKATVICTWALKSRSVVPAWATSRLSPIQVYTTEAKNCTCYEPRRIPYAAQRELDTCKDRLSMLQRSYNELEKKYKALLPDPNDGDGPSMHELSWTMRDVRTILGFREGYEYRHEARRVADRIAELEREQKELINLRDTLKSQRRINVGYADELEAANLRIENLCNELAAQTQRAMEAEAAFRRERKRADALHAELSTERRELAALRHQLQDRESALWAERIKVSEYKDRYRSRRQSEEPAPRGAVVMRWNDTRANWYPIAGINLNDLDTWTHQPPAPGEGE